MIKLISQYLKRKQSNTVVKSLFNEAEKVASQRELETALKMRDELEKLHSESKSLLGSLNILQERMDDENITDSDFEKLLQKAHAYEEAFDKKSIKIEELSISLSNLKCVSLSKQGADCLNNIKQSNNKLI